MDLPFAVILVIVVVTAAALAAGVAVTIRAFKSSEPRPATARVETHPKHPISRHDQPTTELLKRFFDGKECAVCKRPIPAIQRTGLKPGLLNPATHETYSWDEIPNENLPAILETQLPLCSECQVAESFRERFRDRVVDRDRTIPDTHPQGRIGTAGS